MIESTRWIDEIYKNDMTMWYFKQTQNEYILIELIIKKFLITWEDQSTIESLSSIVKSSMT